MLTHRGAGGERKRPQNKGVFVELRLEVENYERSMQICAKYTHVYTQIYAKLPPKLGPLETNRRTQTHVSFFK